MAIPYEYWAWSLPALFIIQGLKEGKSQIAYINGKKYKFLCEHDYTNCEYNGVVVLNNRYNTYVDHNFIS